MSSVIVLDSSDEEEVPTKKAFLAPSIPATITPIKTTTSKCPTTNQLKHKKTKQRPIPSGITITRRSPVNLSTAAPNLNNNNNNTNTSAANTNTRPPSFNDSFVAATISAATLAATSKLNSILSINKTGTATGSSILKTNATTKERQTPTPPRQQTQQQMQAGQKTQQQQQMQATKQQQQAAQQVARQQQQQQPQQVLPHLSQLPQLQPSPLVLSKRLSATPIQQQPAPKLQKSKQQQNLPKMQMQQQKQRTLNASPATITPINIGGGSNQITKTVTSSATAAMLPMISSVQSMADSATPPLQLLATPPHSAATTFNDHQLFSPKSMHTTCSLPPSTTVTATRPQMSSSGNNNNNTNISSSSNNKNINNNFKIMLPPKSSTNTTPTSTPTPVALQQISAGPRIAYVNSLAPQNQLTTTTTSNNNKATNSNNKNSTATTAAALPIPIGLTATAAASTAAQSPIMPTVSSGLGSVRRVKPTTLLRKNDEAWLNRSTSNAASTPPAGAAAPTTAAKNFFDDDLALELLPHSRSSTYTTNTKTAAQKAAAAEFVKNMALRTPMIDSDADDSMLIIPNTLTITSTRNSYSSSSSSTQKSVLRKSYPLKIDLTDSPEKAYKARNSNTPTVTPPPPPSASIAKSKSIERITNGGAKSTAAPTTPTPPPPPSPPPLSTEYEELLKVCAAADSSADMGKLVKSKLPKYYHNAHPDFVRSKGFSKSLRTVITNIQKEPDLVYLHLKTIVDELKVRSKSKEVLPTAAVVIKSEAQNADGAIVESVGDGNGVASGSSNTVAGGSVADSVPVEDPTSTGNKHTDEQIKKLNKALYILTKRIEVLEAAEVDWEDEDSSYLQVERFKKRACQIYEKICDLTGESKNAHRLVKKPIHFNGTTYTQFNKTLQAYVNRTKEFPDYFDVLRMLEHCNRQYDYALANFEMKRIAHDAFIKIGKLLQSRRKTDLYETVTHFTAHEKDPATIDPTLQAKLSENQKKRTRISDVIEKYAREQDMIREELKEARQAKVAKALKSGSSDDDDDDDDDNVEEDDAVASTSASAAKVAVKRTKKKHKKENGETADKENKDVIALDGDDDDDDDDDDDEDEDEVNGSDLEADVEKLANGYLSDVDSDVEIVINNTTEEFDSETPKEDDKTKDKKDSLTVVVDDRTEIATKDKLKADATLKTQKGDTIPQTTTPTEQQQQLSNISINSNNGTRQKTADPLAIATQQANKATPTTTSTTTEIDGSKIVTAAGIANGCMRSVTDPNLENKTNIVVGKEGETIVADHQSSCSVTMQTQKQSTATTTKEGKRQRTVSEIVISDEES